MQLFIIECFSFNFVFAFGAGVISPCFSFNLSFFLSLSLSLSLSLFLFLRPAFKVARWGNANRLRSLRPRRGWRSCPPSSAAPSATMRAASNAAWIGKILSGRLCVESARSITPLKLML